MPRETPKPEKSDFGKAKMSPLARAHLAKFERFVDQDLSEAETIPLVVLVWGPGASGGELYDKRLQIRDMLRENGDAALFSEEMAEVCAGFEVSERTKELIQANQADFIVVLYGSPGAIAETHDFGGFLEVFGPKMLVCIDSRHADSYGYHGLLEDLGRRYNNVHKYTWPEDIRDCHLVTEITKRLKWLRAGKWWAARLGKA